MEFIPQIQPWINEEELKQLKRAIDSTYITENKLTKEFEELIRQYTGAKYVISVFNGTVALYCILKYYNFSLEDEVVVPDLTYIATYNSVLWTNAKPILCDVNKETCCMDVESLDKVVTKNTKAILPVHLYGNHCNMNEICNWAKKRNIVVLEDAAQSFGTKYDGIHSGLFGDSSIFSFYGNKIFTTSEGGVILTNNDDIYEKCYTLKNHGRMGKGFVHDDYGLNFCFTDLQAAVGIAQMHKIDKIIQKKKDIFEYYNYRLNKLIEKGILKNIKIEDKVEPNYWFTSFIVNNRENLENYLLSNNIQTRRFFCPMHMQPCIKVDKEKYKNYNSVYLYENGLSLPSSYSLTYEQLDYICDKIQLFYGK